VPPSANVGLTNCATATPAGADGFRAYPVARCFVTTAGSHCAVDVIPSGVKNASRRYSHSVRPVTVSTTSPSSE
jgi:hypothetical protein